MGYLAMLLGLVALILVHEFGHWFVARIFGFKTPVFSIGFGPRRWSIILGRFWQTEFRLSPILLGGYVSIPELQDESTARQILTESGHESPEVKTFPIWKRTMVAVAGVTMNVVFCLVAMFATFAIVGKPHAVVDNVYVHSVSNEVVIARDAGIQPNDQFVSVDGVEIKHPDDLVKALGANKSEPTTVVVRRGQQEVTIHLTPDANGKIGIVMGVNQHLDFVAISTAQAASEAGRVTVEGTKNVVHGFAIMLKLAPAPQGADTSVHGFVGIMQMGNNAFEAGLFNFIWFLSMMSLNLAVFNILPFPILDGGYLIFFAIEKVRGKPVSAELRNRIFSFAFMALMALMVLGLYNDFARPINK